MDNNYMFCTKCMYFNMLSENLVNEQSVPSVCSSCTSFCDQGTNTNIHAEELTMNEGIVAIA